VNARAAYVNHFFGDVHRGEFGFWQV
jgi:hypothetical protein